MVKENITKKSEERICKMPNLVKTQRSLERTKLAKELSCSSKGLSLVELEMIKTHRSARKFLLKGQELRLEVHPRPF